MPDGVDEGQHHVEAVLDDEDAVARLGERAQRAHQKFSAVFVEVGERFVEDDDALPHRERRGGDQPLLLPAREGAALPLRVQLHEIADDLDLFLYLFGREGEIFAAEGDLVLYDLLDDLLVCILQHDAHLAADLAQFFALDALSRDVHFARKRAADDARDDARDDVHQRALALSRVAGEEGHLAVRGGKVEVFEYFRLSVVRKADLFEFDCVHKTTTNTAPATMPQRKMTSERASDSFL